MVFLTIILSFVYTFGLGFSVTRFVKESENLLERNLMRVGLGLASMITLGLFLNIIRVPLDWRIFLILSLIIPLFYLFKNIKAIKALNFKFRLTKYDLSISVMLLIFFATFYMYASGAFSYPWLEDDDSWGHALGVKYVAIEKKVFAEKPLRYIDPYPPSYDMLFGILHQTNDSVYWTLKFFNALIISLSLIFFFFFVKELTDNKNKALFSTFALASLPAFLSHFIWAIALNIPLYFTSFYAVERIKHGKRWFIVAAIMVGAASTISPTHSVYFGLFFVAYYLTKAIMEKNILIYHAAAGFFGLLISFFLWWLPTLIKHGLKNTYNGIGANLSGGFLNIPGTADKIYTLSDFIFAQKINMINNPIGIGFVLSLLFVIAITSIMYKYKDQLNKNKLVILVIFSVIMIVLLYVLSSTYTKNVWSIKKPIAEKGSVPFFEFISDQILLITILSITIFLYVLLIISKYKTENFKDNNIILYLAWFILSFLALNAGPFYYKITPFRVWSIFSIPLAILSAEGLWFLFAYLKNLRFLKIIVLVIVIIGVTTTSAYQKYIVNTAQWPPGGFWTSVDEVNGYLWIKDNLPKNSKLFTFVNNAPVIGMDMFTCHWCSDVQDYQRNGFNKTWEENYNFLKKEGYSYIVIDGQTARRFGHNSTNTKIQEYLNSNKFKRAFGNNGMLLLKVL